ncbi:MAG: ABC transporter permease [Clostridiales bacterium]|nr:ABC transporter permease [Clostridiales bacterium]
MSNVNVPVKKSTDHGKSFTKTLGQYSFVIIFLFLFAAYLIINKNITWNGVMNIPRHSAVVGVISFGMGLVIITGGIDLSVGSILALVGGLSVVVFNATNSLWLTLLFALAAGALCGFINGFLIGKAKMPAFIVTLATMMIYRSIAQFYLRAVVRQSIYNMDGTLSSYDAFFGFGQYKLFDLFPIIGLVLILVTAIMVFVSTNTKYGKTIYAIGSNEKAAKLAGVNVEWTRTSVYVITGLLCGFAAFLWLAMNGAVDPATMGKSNEMYAIAAVVIGGISMSGGKGKLLGVLFGAMSYTSIDKIISALGVDALINDAIKGAILLVAVLVQIVVPLLRRKAKASK